MKRRFDLARLLILGLIPGALLILASGAFAEEPKPPLPIQELRAFAEIFGRIKENYVEPVDDKSLLEYAIRGMLAGLDPHSSYLNEEEFADLQAGTSGEFGGLGIEVGHEDGFVKVISPIDDTPAQRAGVKAGDLIIRLDEKPVKGMSLEEAVSLMRGKPGTEVILTIAREGEEKPLRITVVRDIIKVASVKGRMLEEGFAYVRLSHFQARTTDDMLKKISQLKAESKDGIRGLVLDLRNNPGGILNGAVSISDAFLTDGIVVYTQGRNEESRLDFNAAPDDVLDGAPIVVLVNGGSASASEIVAGALQDHRRAIIMGSQTFGKGSVQTIIPVSKTAAVKLTTARYFTPSGRSIQGEGIKPDIVLSDAKLTRNETDESTRIKEADLAGHLENGNGNAAPEADPARHTPPAPKVARVPDIEDDYQLSEALNLLKGISIYNSWN
ncbi:S41 family peptidase [Sedimenticola selenatireducens]|uniref:Peptidase S41 n=1 Tax=Sedimenticola selenatireducens TaxID=191960 RepID=A0A2N6CUD0_9GAMM|nr:S41 family peptidase [Sedimenticola selenatireducens]PLX60765.1 MAG: peptidase S41 [Sedimenticola selenatireducens]